MWNESAELVDDDVGLKQIEKVNDSNEYRVFSSPADQNPVALKAGLRSIDATCRMPSREIY